MKRILILTGLLSCFCQQVYADCINPSRTLSLITGRIVALEGDLGTLAYLLDPDYSALRSRLSDIFLDLAELNLCSLNSAQSNWLRAISQRAQTILRSIPR